VCSIGYGGRCEMLSETFKVLAPDSTGRFLFKLSVDSNVRDSGS